mgnify:CR=1 FL=1
MKSLIGACLLLVSASALADPVEITLTPVPLHKENPSITTAGKLTHLAGYQLTAAPAAFGGWSGMQLAPDGQAFVAVSDGGAILKARIEETAPGKITAITAAQMAPLRHSDGSPVKGKRTEDAEGLIDLSGGALTGPFLVSFERDDRILRYDEFGGPGVVVFRPPESVAIPDNDGMEAIVRLQSGLFLLLTEKAMDNDGHIHGFLWDGANPPRPISLKKNGRHWPTEAALLPNGDVVLLERDWNPIFGLSISLRRIAAGTIHPGAVLDGEILGTMHGNTFHMDNMEGLGVRRTADGRTLIYVLSDDNFNRKGQRTLLQIFTLKD